MFLASRGVFRVSNMAEQLLEFETEMFLSLLSNDGLLVVAEGMGIDRILLQFMRVYSEQGSLVLLLNTTTPEQVHISWKRLGTCKQGGSCSW